MDDTARLKRLAARIDALVEKDEGVLRRSREIAAQRRAAAADLHRPHALEAFKALLEEKPKPIEKPPAGVITIREVLETYLARIEKTRKGGTYEMRKRSFMPFVNHRTKRGLLGKKPVAELPTIWLDRTTGQSNFQVWSWLPRYLRWYRYAFGSRLS